MSHRFARAVLALLSLAGCSDGTPGVAALDATGASDGAAPDEVVRADAGPSFGDPPDADGGSTGCPADPPRPGGRCAGAQRSCTYGSDPLAVCRPRFECLQGAWHPIFRTPCDVIDSCPDGPDASACPPTHKPCFTADAHVCTCYSGLNGTDGGVQWQCIGAGAGCPVLAPNLGTSCTPPGDGSPLSCDYGPERCGPDFAIACIDGTWVNAGGCSE